MSVHDDGTDLGKDITDPAGGSPEVRGGESPADWTGPLPEVPPGKVRGDWCGHPECGGD